MNVLAFRHVLVDLWLHMESSKIWVFFTVLHKIQINFDYDILTTDSRYHSNALMIKNPAIIATAGKIHVFCWMFDAWISASSDSKFILLKLAGSPNTKRFEWFKQICNIRCEKILLFNVFNNITTFLYEFGNYVFLRLTLGLVRILEICY